MWNSLVVWFSEIDPVIAALTATIFTWLLLHLYFIGVFFQNTPQRNIDGMLGFTGGVMVAASCFGLLGPAIDQSVGEGFVKIIPAASGFILVALFLFALDKYLPHLHINFKENESEGIKTDWHRTTLLVLAITMHNIPEGLAVGVMFGAAMGDTHMISEALIVAIGIGIQNFPEGIAVSMPLRRQSVTRFKSFWYGQLSAIVEPIAGVLGAIAFLNLNPSSLWTCCRSYDLRCCRRSNP